MPALKPSAKPYFLDTNVLVYAYSAQDSAKREIARTLTEADGATISTQVLSELANVLIKRFGVPANEVRKRLLSIANACTVVQITPSIVLDALRVVERYQFGFFDSQIIATALASTVSTLYTEDLQANQIIDGTLTIRSPFAPRAEQPRASYRVKQRRSATNAT
ncbi:MAG: PIN domain-containing protein [Burkholderiales bacterium]